MTRFIITPLCPLMRWPVFTAILGIFTLMGCGDPKPRDSNIGSESSKEGDSSPISDAAPDPRQSPRDVTTNTAMKSVFGAEQGGAITVGNTTVNYTEGKLVRSGESTILISAGMATPSAHPDPGYVGVWYLRRKIKDFRVVKAYPSIVALGSFGNAPEWKMRYDLGLNPVVEVTGFGMWFGHAYTCTSLISLKPSAPEVLISGVLTGYQFDPGDDPAEIEKLSNIEGVISYDKRRDNFTVHYSGTEHGIIYYDKVKSEYTIRTTHWRPSKSC